MWLDPIPVEEDLIHAYSQYYTHKSYNRSRGLVFGLYRSFFYMLDAVVVFLGGQSSRRRSLTRMYLQDAAPGRLLDIGAGSGRFLHEMNMLGWKVEGLEVDVRAAEVAREQYGVCVHACGLREMKFASDSFDAITLNHVLEHLPDPVAVLAECARLLKRGGRLVCVTPNADSWGHKRFGKNWRGLEPPRHLHIFNLRNLEACASRAGLARFNVSTNAGDSWPMLYESLLLESGADYTIGCGDRPKSLALQALLLEFKECRLFRENPGVGEVCVLLCEKADCR